MADAERENQSIEQLTQRYTMLNTEKITAEANLKTARKHLDGLKEQARKEYSTDNLDELKAKLQQMEQENEKKRAKYQASLDEIETELEALRKKYIETEETSEEAAKDT